MAYACVVSLKQTLEPLLDPGRSRIQIPNSELKLIYDDLCYAKSFFDKINSLEDGNIVEELESQIKDVAQNIQDLIELHLSDLVDSGSESSIAVFSGELVEVKEKLGSIIKKLKAKEDYLTGEQQQLGAGFGRKIVRLADVDVSSRIDFGNNVLVGLDNELNGLIEKLVGGGSRRVITIVGMAGIGKTTLVKTAYLYPYIKEYFDICLFVEIDLEYDLKEILLRLLSQEREEARVDKLGLSLHQYLFRRRFLIVLDNMWDIDIWDEIQRFLPDNGNGSRIILTSRNANLARKASGEESILQKRFLNNEESWDLLCKIAFPDMKECPVEVEEVGKTIAKNLGGHPLGIVMIGRLLAKSETTVENWMAVAENIDSRVQETTIPTFMKLSYTELPQHLKACFLYLGLFPPNYDIPTAQLFKLWVAEGFIEPVAGKSLEQKAEEYLQDLVSRSLVIVHKLSSTGRIRSCRMHPLLQDLCVSEARREKVFHIVKKRTTSSLDGTRNPRRLGIQLNDVAPGVLESVSRVRSLVFILPQHQRPLQPHVLLRFRWLRVLHAVSVRFREFPDEVVKLVRLRYLAITYDGELPSSISKLRNLEVLIIHPTQSQTINPYAFLPIEIWKLHKLRHLQCVGFDLPDPSAAATRHRSELFLNKLLTLSGVSARTCIEGVLARMPNLIKLGIRLQATSVSSRSCTGRVLARMANLIKLGIRLEATEQAVEMSCFDAVYTNLHHLESFKCAGMNRGLRSEATFSLISFPFGLRKLTLRGCGLLWDKLTFPHSLQKLTLEMWNRELEWEKMMLERIGSLPLLERLQMLGGCFKTGKWEIGEDQFPCLKYLRLRECYGLKEWTMAEESCSIFPRLEYLHLGLLQELKLEIPREIGDIPTLQKITLFQCSNSVVRSAKVIVEEQMELQGEHLPFHVEVFVNPDEKYAAQLRLAGPDFVVKG